MTHGASGLPGKAGWRMPAEWEPHQATWICWPQRQDDWPGKFGPIPWVYAEIVKHLSQSENVHILVDRPAVEKQVRKLLDRVRVDLARVSFFVQPTDRVWTRDYGPTFLTNAKGQLGCLDWQFNGWAKYSNWKRDNKVAGAIAKKLKLPAWKPAAKKKPVVMEGGAIEVNGQGVLLTTDECLLGSEQCRNPGLTRGDLEKVFAEYLGIRKVLWLSRGIEGDDTHGHIDDLARFVNPTTIVTAMEENSADPNYNPLQENLERLRGMSDADDNRIRVITLPMPAPIFVDDQRLPASYANFYIANDRVLVPTFNDANDRVALNTLAELFPNREVIGIHSVDLLWGLGTLHCLTQQMPASIDERRA